MQTKRILKLKKKLNQTADAAAEPSLLTTGTGAVKPIAGASIGREQLRQIAMKVAEAGDLHLAELIRAGGPPGMVDAVKAALEEFDAISKDLAAAKEETEVYSAAVEKAYAFKDKLAPVIKGAAFDRPEVLVKSPLKLKGKYTGVRISRWFSDVQGTMDTLKAEIAKVPGADWSAELNAQQLALKDAIGVYQQHLALKKARTGKRLASKNKLVKAVQQIVVVAGIAFTRNPEVLAQFQRTKARKRKAKAIASGSPVSPSSEGAGAGSSKTAENTGAAAAPATPPQGQPASAAPHEK